MVPWEAAGELPTVKMLQIDPGNATNGLHGSWIIGKNTITMEHESFRGAGLHVKKRYKWKPCIVLLAYLCFETSLFDDFEAKTFKVL